MTRLTLPASRLGILGPRLGLSLVILALIVGVVRFSWYPGLHFDLAGISKFVMILAGVVLVTGPGLTVLVYRRDKKGMVFDLVAILIVELVAVGLAANSLYSHRPLFMVFTIDRFEIVSADEITDADFRFASLRDAPGKKPVLAVARFPDNVEERAALKADIFFAGALDIDRRPDHWYPYETGLAAVLEAAREPTDAHIAAGAGEFTYLPVTGKAQDASVLIDPQTAYPAGMVDVDPWQ